MDIENLRIYCLSLPYVTEDVKWGHDLCFCIGGKMFCVTGLTKPWATSLKVSDEQFEELILKEGIIPAPYMARYKWIRLEELGVLKDVVLKTLIKNSYEMVKAKLPKKVLNELI